MPRPDYRPEIDGLRAIAVIAVLLYHAGFQTVHGGFVGVDVFFVISGFLITRLVLREIDAGTFTLRGFYARRIRRLGPALLFTILCVLLVGGLCLAPSHLIRLATSALHALFSTSNFHFWNDTGYFDAEAALEPLLHTWSLAVEEQFYFVWPTVLLAASWRGRHAVRVVAMCVSFGVSLWLSERMLNRDPPAAFFLAPFRVFELSLGGLVSVLDERVRLGRARKEALVVLGLAGVAWPIFTYDASDRFPGLLALLPCAGTASVILGGEARWAAAFLRARPMVFVGAISYSLYLIHWPLVRFYKFVVHDDLATAERLALALAAIAGAALMYRFIEQPFRRRRAGASQGRISFAAGMIGLLTINAALAGSVLLTGGWRERFPSALSAALDPSFETSSRAFSWRAFNIRDRKFSASTGLKLLIVGDSQAADLVNLLEYFAAKHRVEVASFPTSKFCQMPFSPELFSEDTKRARDCLSSARKLAADPRIAQADIVILGFAWFPEVLAHLPSNVDALHALGARKVVVLGRKDQGESSIDTLVRQRSFQEAENAAAAHKSREAWEVNARLRNLAGSFVYLDLMSAICPAPDDCHVVDANRQPILFDRRHFTEAGARFIAARWFALPETAAIFVMPAEEQPAPASEPQSVRRQP